MFWMPDKSLCVVDHKSAHNRETDDPFLPQYKIQVIGYANIAELGLELGTVSRGGIWYWDIQHKEVIADPKSYLRKGRICPPFTPKLIDVEIDYKRLDPLFRELKKVWKASDPPQRREKCSDCSKRDALFAIEDDMLATDQKRYGNLPYFQDASARRIFDRRFAWYSALNNLGNPDADSGFAPGGMVSAWQQ